MVDKKKEQTNDTWANMENPMSILGKFAWLIALGSVAYTLISGIVGYSGYSAAYAIANGLPEPWRSTQIAALNASMAGMVWFFICAGVTLVLIFIYVLKPFGTKCAAKDWESLINDKIGGGFPKMWLFAILLAIFSYGWGCVGVLVPVIMLTFVGPGKGKVFAKK